VRAVDAQQRPVANLPVTFLVSGGQIAGASVITDRDGLAKISAWMISTGPGDNVVSANADGVPPVKFVVKGTPGAATQVTSLATTEQFALPGRATQKPPAVRVTDRFGNFVAGVVVIFDVVAGGGSVSPRGAVTDSLGIAATQWTLGADSTQILTATVNSLAPVTFTARSLRPSGDCNALLSLTGNATLASELSTNSCASPDGRYEETFALELSSQSAWRFDMTSIDFNTTFELRDVRGALVGRSDSVTASRNSTLRAILPAGIYQLIASSTKPKAVGHYQIKYGAAPTAAICGDAFVTRGLNLRQDFDYYTCAALSTFNGTEDRYRITLQAGMAIHLELDDLSYDDPSIALLNEKGEVVAKGKQAGAYLDMLDFIPDVDGTYTILIKAGGEEFISYIIVVK
jgi:hypothetical protein